MSDLEDIRNKKLFVNINGQEMQVEFDFNALAYLEEKTGLGRYEFYRKVFNVDENANPLTTKSKLSTKEELILIHAGLIRHNETITLKEIGQITSFDNIILPVFQAYTKIWLQPESYNQIYFPEEEKGTEKK
jgi:hypothetical protein